MLQIKEGYITINGTISGGIEDNTVTIVNKKIKLDLILKAKKELIEKGYEVVINI